MQLQIGVKVLIKNSEGQYLFIKRRELLAAEKTTSWDIPGGRINPDEELLTALKREVKEEVDHTLQGQPQLIAAQDIIIPKKDLHVVRLTYIATEDIATVILSDEHELYQWYHLNDLADLMVEPYLAAVINTLATRPEVKQRSGVI